MGESTESAATELRRVAASSYQFRQVATSSDQLGRTLSKGPGTFKAVPEGPGTFRKQHQTTITHSHKVPGHSAAGPDNIPHRLGTRNHSASARNHSASTRNAESSTPYSLAGVAEHSPLILKERLESWKRATRNSKTRKTQNPKRT